jgi:hypothetical protein
MVNRRQVTASFLNPAVVLLIPVLSFFSCVLPKNYQLKKPFVYKTNIKVKQQMPNDEKQDLISRLQNQLDDSLQVKTTTAIFSWKPIAPVYKKLDAPPVFDTLNVSRSLIFMNSLLYSMGYYAPKITDTVWSTTKKRRKNRDEHRVFVSFTVVPGKKLTLDSIGFDLQTPVLQALAMESKDQSLLQKGKPYSKQILSNELNRLVDTFRNNGYYRFSREDLYIEHDTVIAALIDPTLDPFQQAELMEKLKIKRENPTINVVVKQRPVRDSSHLMKYYIGNVTVYPDLPTIPDTTIVKTDTNLIRRITFITRSNKFKLPFIANNIYLRQGRVYKQENYFRTSNRFAQLSAWQYTNIDLENSDIGDSVLDVTMRMYPAKKQKFNVDLEASRNSNDILTASNLFGVGINFGLQNRNVYKQSIQTSTNLRGGVELGADFIQTTQASLSHTIAIPHRILPNFMLRREGRLRTPQTLINLTASYVDRRQFFTSRTINGSFGYNWAKVRQRITNESLVINSTHSFLWKPVNIEYTTLDGTDSFYNQVKSNPTLLLAFKTGLVIGQQFLYNSVRQKGNKTNVFRFSAEESGALLGFITELDKGDLFRFIKGDLQFTHTIDYGKTQLAMNSYGGAGVSYGKAGNGYEQTLPFQKAFFSGGPNGMRAWSVRRLGLGSSTYYNDTPRTNLDRFGDIKLEGNLEYRFLLGTLFEAKFRGALFVDIGNIWSRKPIDTTASAQGSDFQLNRFYKEFAVGMGTGLRIDFTYFLIRLDWAYKVRDPQRGEFSDRWFYDLHLGDGQFQLGIGYPF